MEFFNDLSKRFSTVAKSVTEKTRDSVEATRLSNDLRAQRNALEQLYCDLGKVCYAMRNGDGDPEQAEQLSNRIQRTLSRIDELVAQRDAIRDVRRCPSCGHVMPRDARFCAFCGKRLPEDAPQFEDRNPADAEYCPDCGAQRTTGDRFCAVCGRSFDPKAPAQPPIMPEFGDIAINPEEPDNPEEDRFE